MANLENADLLPDFDMSDEVVDSYDWKSTLSNLKKEDNQLDNSEDERNIKDETEWMSFDGNKFKSLYPDLTDLLTQSETLDEYEKKLWPTISAIYTTRILIPRYFNNIKNNEPTWDIDLEFSLIDGLFDDLQSSPNYANPIYQHFVSGERIQLWKLKEESKKVIGDKKRWADHIYR